jgi:hypothetical protein
MSYRTLKVVKISDKRLAYVHKTLMASILVYSTISMVGRGGGCTQLCAVGPIAIFLLLLLLLLLRERERERERERDERGERERKSAWFQPLRIGDTLQSFEHLLSRGQLAPLRVDRWAHLHAEGEAAFVRHHRAGRHDAHGEFHGGAERLLQHDADGLRGGAAHVAFSLRSTRSSNAPRVRRQSADALGLCRLNQVDP